jgi:hypothetical protein
VRDKLARYPRDEAIDRVDLGIEQMGQYDLHGIGKESTFIF